MLHPSYKIKNKRDKELLRPKGYVLHHVDPNDPDYEQWNNVVIMSKSDHTRLHRLLPKLSEAEYYEMLNKMINNPSFIERLKRDQIPVKAQQEDKRKYEEWANKQRAKGIIINDYRRWNDLSLEDKCQKNAIKTLFEVLNLRRNYA
jgi:hypothetical protein